MTIRSIGPAAQRPAAPAAPVAPTGPSPDNAEKAKSPGPPAHAQAHGYRRRQDSVAISDAARALASAPAPDAAPASVEAKAPAAGALGPARLDELRRKVLEGAYNQAAVVDQVAQRLLASGDV